MGEKVLELNKKIERTTVAIMEMEQDFHQLLQSTRQEQEESELAQKRLQMLVEEQKCKEMKIMTLQKQLQMLNEEIEAIKKEKAAIQHQHAEEKTFVNIYDIPKEEKEN